MKNLKIYKILAQLDVYQRNRFLKYLQSPYFNQKDSLIKLAEFFDEKIRGTNASNIENEQIWKKLLIKDVYSDKKFRKLCSDITQHLQNFLSVEIFLDGPLQITNNLLEAIHKKDIKELHASTLSKAGRLSERRLDKSSDFYYQQYRLQRNIYNITNYELNRREDSNIENIINNLDYFYLTEKLKNHCNLLIRKNYGAKSHQNPLFEEIVAYIEANRFDEIPSISIYYNMYKLISNPKVEYYNKLKLLLGEFIDIFPNEESLDIYHVLINYCVGKVNSGNEKYYREMLNIYQEGLKNNMLFYKDELEPWDFKNIVIVALRLKEFDWTRDFIEVYHIKLNERYRKNAYAFNKARLFLYEKNYEGVKSQLNKVVFDDFSYNLSSKAMLQATYYELGEFEILNSFFKSFSIFLNRNKNKLPAQRLKNYKGLIYFTKKLTKMAETKDYHSISILRGELVQAKNISDVKWLLEKIDELESKISSGKKKRAI